MKYRSMTKDKGFTFAGQTDCGQIPLTRLLTVNQST